MPEAEKHLRCRDVGMDCDFEAHGRNEDEVMQQAAAHAAKTHGITEITPEVLQAVESKIVVAA